MTTDTKPAMPTPPAAWDEYALREAQRLWELPAMPKAQLVATLQVALINAMWFVWGRAAEASDRERIAARQAGSNPSSTLLWINFF